MRWTKHCSTRWKYPMSDMSELSIGGGISTYRCDPGDPTNRKACTSFGCAEIACTRPPILACCKDRFWTSPLPSPRDPDDYFACQVGRKASILADQQPNQHLIHKYSVLALTCDEFFEQALDEIGCAYQPFLWVCAHPVLAKDIDWMGNISSHFHQSWWSVEQHSKFVRKFEGKEKKKTDLNQSSSNNRNTNCPSQFKTDHITKLE